jgi:Lon protease-like protein
VKSVIFPLAQHVKMKGCDLVLNIFVVKETFCDVT